MQFPTIEMLPRTHGPKVDLLTIEMVPRTCWASNVRSLVSRGDWNWVRAMAYAQAGYRCEICGGTGSRYAVACHEVWDYDDATHVQRLVRVIALCPACHEVKHFGRATNMGRRSEALAHLRTVNRWSAKRARAHEREAIAEWRARSEHKWTLDLSALESYALPGVVLAPADRPRGVPTDWA